MKLLSLFSGIGAFEKALTNIDIDYELVGFSEVDEYAIQSYCAIHNVKNDMNLGDISKISNRDLPKDVDIVTYGFPCQDLSIMGRKAGIEKGTRSGLLFEAERVINHVKPKYAIAENVKNMVSNTFRPDFDKLLHRLEGYGYNNYWAILNSKDYGIPQNRERIFVVSIRKDVDDGSFEFPLVEEDYNKTVADIIDVDVTKRSCKSNLKPYFHPSFFKDYRSNVGIKKLFDGVVQGYFTSSYSLNRIYSIHGICPTLTTSNQHHFYEIGGRLLPHESFRMMGFTDEDYKKAKKTGVSDHQLYRQAGNSIVVPILESIFQQLLKK